MTARQISTVDLEGAYKGNKVSPSVSGTFLSIKEYYLDG